MRLLVVVCLLVISFIRADEAEARLLGIRTCNWLFGQSRIYAIDEQTGSQELLATIDNICLIRSLTRRGIAGEFYALSIIYIPPPNGDPLSPVARAGAYLIRINPHDWTVAVGPRISGLATAEHPFPRITALAFSPDDVLYAIEATSASELEDAPNCGEHSGGVSVLWRIDPDNGLGTRIGPMCGHIAGIDFTPHSPSTPTAQLYGWDVLRGLVTIDTSTGSATDIDGRGNSDIKGIAFRPGAQLIGAGRHLYRIDRVTGDFQEVPIADAQAWNTVDAIHYLGGEAYMPFEPEPRTGPLWQHRLNLFDCWPCINCFGRMCDPRVNPKLDTFYIIDPARKLAQPFSRAALGLKDDERMLMAAAPVGGDKAGLFVATAPYADAKAPNVGAIIFFDSAGKISSRIYGQEAEENLGQSVDVRGEEIVAVSKRRLLRLRGEKIVAKLELDKKLHAHRGIKVAFTDDIDGDSRPEILLAAPFATEKGLKRPGLVQVIGSQTGKVIKTLAGSDAQRYLNPRQARIKRAK